jgi:hypothetical protein
MNSKQLKPSKGKELHYLRQDYALARGQRGLIKGDTNEDFLCQNSRGKMIQISRKQSLEVLNINDSLSNASNNMIQLICPNLTGKYYIISEGTNKTIHLHLFEYSTHMKIKRMECDISVIMCQVDI